MLFYIALATLADDERSCAEEIFITYEKRIYSIALKILKNHHDAEDTLDRVMINVIENIDKFFGQNRNIIEAQIVIYTRNEAINLYNKNVRRSKREISYTCLSDDGVNIDVDIIDETSYIEDIVISKETMESVEKYLHRLPIEYRDTIKLVYVCGYSNKEAAKILHVTPNAVVLRLFKAKNKLINMVGGEFSERI